MKYKSRTASVNAVKKFFTDTNSDSITTEDAYHAWGRDMGDDMKNKSWFSAFLTHLKYHNLIEPVYTVQNYRKVLTGVRLTDEGRSALGRSEELKTHEQKQKYANSGPPTNGEQMNFNKVMRIIAQFREDNPEYEVTFDIKLKGS